MPRSFHATTMRYVVMMVWAISRTTHQQYYLERNLTILFLYVSPKCILCLLTFYISILPFSSDEEGTWEIASYRVLNVLIGCLLGALLSISIFPRSTVGILQTKIENQVRRLELRAIFKSADRFLRFNTS